MGSRYFFILMYCLIEKYFSRGDFDKVRVKLKSKVDALEILELDKQKTEVH
jgi:hypothetical protein